MRLAIESAGEGSMRVRRCPADRSLAGAALLLGTALVFAPLPAQASLFALTASGTIAFSNEATIPAGTPWSLEVVYDADAPDVDFQVLSAPSPSLGEFNNTTDPPALVFFHYQAGGYEVTVDQSEDFQAGSDILITFSAVRAIDINLGAPDLFPALGGPVSFHADFNDFQSRPVFASDALPTDPAFGPDSFDEIAVSLLAPSGSITGTSLESFAVTPVPEPSTVVLSSVGLVVLLMMTGRERRLQGWRRG